MNENTSNSELQEAFSKYGNVVDTYNTGKGYAFVTFDNKEDASTVSLVLLLSLDGVNDFLWCADLSKTLELTFPLKATDQLNGQEILGQQVKVNVARPKEGGGGGGGGYGGGRGGGGYGRYRFISTLLFTIR